MQRELKPVFIQTKNVRNFNEMMKALDRAPGEGRFACVYSVAGYGKTETVKRWHALSGSSYYLRMLEIWQRSPRAFLAAFAKELGASYATNRIEYFHDEIVARLRKKPVPIFLDEIEKLPITFLEIVRDITDLTGAPVVLIGEEYLLARITDKRLRRVWSRTLEVMEFKPLKPEDVVVYALEAADAKIPEECAIALSNASGGDIRTMKRDLGAALRIANARKSDITIEVINAAIKAGARGAA